MNDICMSVSKLARENRTATSALHIREEAPNEGFLKAKG